MVGDGSADVRSRERGRRVLASESLDAQCSIAVIDQCDYILPEFPLRYHVEMQRPLTTVAVVAALELDAPIEADYPLPVAASPHEQVDLKPVGLDRGLRRLQSQKETADSVVADRMPL